MEMLKTPVFWLMFAMMTMMSTGGLMVTSNFANFAREFGVADVILYGMAALPLALTVDRMLNGFTRPFFGWVSDKIGRENTMFIAFTLEGFGVLALLYYAHDPLLFVILSGLVFFAWGEIYSLFPTICTDSYGRKYATANYGMLYTAKGTAALLVPLSSVVQQAAGGWDGVFIVTIAANFIAAFMALFIVKPLRRRMLGAPVPAATAPVHVPPMGVIAGESVR